MGKKYKFDINFHTKYRCFFGYIHFQTVATFICILFLLGHSLMTINFMLASRHGFWDIIKIIYGFTAAGGPLYGIKKKKSILFLAWFIGPIYRMCYYLLIIGTFCFVGLFPTTEFGKQINEMLNTHDTPETENVAKFISIPLFLKLAVSILFILESWAAYIIYKCYRYIAEISTDGEYKKPIKTFKKGNDTKSSTTMEKPNKFVAAVKSFFDMFVKKKPSAEIKQHSKADAALAKNNEHAKPKTQQELIRQLKIITNEGNSALVEWDLDYQLINNISEKSESVNFIVKSTPPEVIKKVIKQPPIGNDLSKKTCSSNASNSMKQQSPKEKLSESNEEKQKSKEEQILQPKNTTINSTKKSKPTDCIFEMQPKMQSESVNFIVKSKTTEVVEKSIKQPSLPKQNLSISDKNFSSSEKFPSNATKLQLLPEEKLSNSTISQSNEKNETTISKPKEPVQQPITKNTTKHVECEFKVKLKNHNIQSEAANFTVQTRSTEFVEKVIKQPSSEKQILSQLKSITQPQMSTEINLSTASTSEIKHQLIEPAPPYSSTLSEAPYFNHPKKPKKLISVEVQTDESSFDPRMYKPHQWQQQNIDSSMDNIDNESDFYCLKPITPSSSKKQEHISDQNSPIVYSSGFSSVSDAYLDCSPFQSLSPYPEKAATKVTFLFKEDETCAIEIYQNGQKEKLKNIFENEWTPLYFSMAQKTPEIGEKAQIHLHKFREHVLYDIFKIIGKPINEIINDPEWRFKIVEENRIKCFQIRTQKGPRLYPETSIIAAFLKSMKLQAENYLNFEINKINLCSNFVFTDAQKRIFKNAAEKLDLKILSFFVNDL